jgi:hypothetical protein
MDIGFRSSFMSTAVHLLLSRTDSAGLTSGTAGKFPCGIRSRRVRYRGLPPNTAHRSIAIPSQPRLSSGVAAREWHAVSGRHPLAARLRPPQPTDPPVPAIRLVWPRAMPAGPCRSSTVQAPLLQVPRTYPENHHFGPSADGSTIQIAGTDGPPPRPLFFYQLVRRPSSWRRFVFSLDHRNLSHGGGCGM